MFKHWPIKKKSQENVEDAYPEVPDGEEPPELAEQEEIQELEQDQEDLLEQQLEIALQAPVVEAWPDSQIPPDSFVEPMIAEDGMGSAMEILMEIPDSQPEVAVNDTYMDASPEMVPDQKPSPEITPTELEVTPMSCEKAEVGDSSVAAITTRVTDPLPSAHLYTPEEVADLQERIRKIKQLG